MSRGLVIAQHLDDIDLQGWRERIDEVRDTLKRASHDDPSTGADGSFCTWSTPRRTLNAIVEPKGGLAIVSERQAMRAGFTLRVATCQATSDLDPSDRTALLAMLDGFHEELEDAVPDEGDDDVPSDTWGVLSRNLHELADDLLSMVAHTFETAGNPDGIEMISEHRITLRTGAPWGTPRLTIRVGGDDLDLLGQGGMDMVATMMKPLTRVSVPKQRTLLLGPASIERAPWRDPGPVARMRSIARFSRSR